jgi:hypothetical protein
MSGPKAGEGTATAALRELRAESGTLAIEASASDDPHEKDTVVPPYDVESYAKLASELPVPVTRSVSVMVSRASLFGSEPAPHNSSRVSVPPPPPTVRRPIDMTGMTGSLDDAPSPPTVRRPDLGAKGILDDPAAMHLVPVRAVSGERLQNSMLDHREGFVLSLIDGQLNIEAIVDVCGMPTPEVLEILESFRLSGVISLE